MAERFGAEPASNSRSHCALNVYSDRAHSVAGRAGIFASRNTRAFGTRLESVPLLTRTRLRERPVPGRVT